MGVAHMGRLGGWAVAAATAGLALCAPTAQAVLPGPGLELGGGGPATDDTSRVVMSARVGADGRTVRLGGTIGTACRKGRDALREFAVDATLADDGTFALTGLETQAAYASLAARGKLDISGTFDGVTASGNVRIYDVRGTKGRRVRCDEAVGTFTLRDPGQPTGPASAPPAPGTMLYGLTGRRKNGLRGGVYARVADNGRTFEELAFAVGMTCGGGPVFPQFTPVKRFNAAGGFDTRESFPAVFSNVTERWRARTRGQFLPGGVLTGRFDATMRRRYTTGKRKGRKQICDPAASVRFWAVP